MSQTTLIKVIQNNSGGRRGLRPCPPARSSEQLVATPMASATRLEMLAMFALCALLFIAAASELEELLWSIQQ